MNRKTRTLLNCILAAALAVGLFMTFRSLQDKSGAADSYEEAARIAMAKPSAPSLPPETRIPEPAPPETTAVAETEAEPVYEWVPAPITEDPEMEKLAGIDLNALREVNPEVIGWIRIPGTRVDYPILKGADNDFYLHHTWQKNRNMAGAIFMEQMCNPDFSDFNTILYGHNMANGTMFSGIVKYQRVNYHETHPYIYLVTDAGVSRYEVFSGYRTELDGVAYSLQIQKTETKESFLQTVREENETGADITPQVTDRILTLSTCYGSSGNLRWVVHARQVMMAVEVPQT